MPFKVTFEGHFYGENQQSSKNKKPLVRSFLFSFTII